MPSPKTEATELSVGFGLLEKDPLQVTEAEIRLLFDGTLPPEKYAAFVKEIGKNQAYYHRFYAIGVSLRNGHPVLALTNFHSVAWEGPRQQARSVSVAKDIVAANVSVSIKADSNVVSNLSPHIMFVSIPSGSSRLSNTDNWFLVTAPQRYQLLYEFVRQHSHGSFPERVADFEKATPKRLRKAFAGSISSLDQAERRDFESTYLSMCREVSIKSAQLMQAGLADSLKGRARSSTAEGIIRRLLRLSESEYVLCGLDKDNEFAVTVPDLTAWKRDWEFKHLDVEPALDRRQSVVNLNLIVVHKATGREHSLPFHVEIRWSHGKFGTNPEAKVYKEFDWADVPFFTEILHSSPIQKLSVLGSGGFGVVYSGIIKKSGKNVAIKELSLRDLSRVSDATEARKRFEREVRIQSSLQHPRILPIIDSDLSAQAPWFAAPIAECSVADILTELPTDETRIKNIYSQVLEAIQYAHSQNVIHRDLKPANILLFEGDRVMVSDFGLGKHMDPSTTVEMLTHSSNNAMGSIPYAAPEQLESFRDADHRADIYSLGVTLSAMVTGREPGSLYSPIIPTGRYGSLIKRCCEQDPADRYQSMAELIQDFRRIQSG